MNRRIGSVLLIVRLSTRVIERADSLDPNNRMILHVVFVRKKTEQLRLSQILVRVVHHAV